MPTEFSFYFSLSDEDPKMDLSFASVNIEKVRNNIQKWPLHPNDMSVSNTCQQEWYLPTPFF